MIFSKGSDQLIVKFEGNVTTTQKDGQPKTTMKGKYAIVSATGGLAGTQGEGSYSGYFTAEDKYRIEWEGTRTVQKDAIVSPVKNCRYAPRTGRLQKRAKKCSGVANATAPIKRGVKISLKLKRVLSNETRKETSP